MIKTTLALLLVGTTLASATTINFNQDTPAVLDFSVEWGATISEYGGGSFTGPGGSVIWWLGEVSRNRNYYFVELHAANNPDLHGFGIKFWSDPDYDGPLPTAYGSPNIIISPSIMPTIYPLDDTPYGARFVFASPTVGGPYVPDGGSTGLLLALGTVGLSALRPGRRTGWKGCAGGKLSKVQS